MSGLPCTCIMASAGLDLGAMRCDRFHVCGVGLCQGSSRWILLKSGPWQMQVERRTYPVAVISRMCCQLDRDTAWSNCEESSPHPRMQQAVTDACPWQSAALTVFARKKLPVCISGKGSSFPSC